MEYVALFVLGVAYGAIMEAYARGLAYHFSRK